MIIEGLNDQEHEEQAPQEQHEGHHWLRLIRKQLGRIILVFNILAILLLWMCCASTWLHPEDYPRLSLMGLAFPVLLVFNLAFIIAWTLVNYRRLWIPLAGMLPCIGFILDYCPISFSSDIPKDCIKIVTWNSNAWGGNYEPQEEGRRLSAEYVKQCDADIICMQESHIWSGATEDLFNYMDSAGYERDEYLGLILFTRLPIIEKDSIPYETHLENGVPGNSSMWYRLKYANDTIIVVNNHLESNRINATIKDDYRGSLDSLEYEGLKKSGKTIGGKLLTSTVLRGAQADSVACFVNRHKGEPIIVCGDFNDTPISYAYQRMKSELTNAYRQSGSGVGFSYNQKGFWVRIDHLFISKEWQSYHTFIDKSAVVSDHYPLVSWLKME